MAAPQINTRIEPEIKEQGDSVLANGGLTGTEAVRSLWQFMASSGTLPDFLAPNANAPKPSKKAAEEGAGLAVRTAKRLGMHLPDSITLPDYESLRSEVYREKFHRIIESVDGQAQGISASGEARA